MIIKDSSSPSHYDSLSSIDESLENPYKLLDVTGHIPSELILKLRSEGFDNMKFYECVGIAGHYFFTARRYGVYEIHHHYEKDGEEVHGKNLMDRTPSRFVATAFLLIDQLVSIGLPVKIIASDLHWRVYLRLARKIAPRRAYIVSDIEYDHRSGNYQFMITRDKSRSLFGGMTLAGRNKV